MENTPTQEENQKILPSEGLGIDPKIDYTIRSNEHSETEASETNERIAKLQQELGMTNIEKGNEKAVADKFDNMRLKVRFLAKDLGERGERKYTEFASRDEIQSMHSIQGRLGSLDYTKPESFIESAKDLNYLAKIIDNFDRKSRSTRDDAESLNRVGKDLRELIRETETLSHELSKNNIPEAGDTQLAAKNLIVVSARQMKFVDQLASIVRDYTRRR